MTSEIRANTIKNRVGLGTIEYSNTGPVISGVTTAFNFKTGTSNLHSTGLNIFDLDVDGHTNLDNVSISGMTTISSSLNGEIFRIETSAGNPGGTQGLAYMGFDHFPASTKPAILIGCEEDGVASYKGNFVVKLKDASATDDDPVQRLKIDSSGRVIIGRASPYGSADADNLIVGDEAVNEHQGITILSHSGKYGGIYFGDGAGSNPTERGKIIYDHPNDQLRIGTAGSAATQFYINSVGNIGIGNSPERDLHIKKQKINPYIKVESTDSSSTYTGINLKTPTLNFQIWNQGPGATGYSGSNSVVFWQAAATGPFAFYHGNSERLRIDSSGRLQIGASNNTGSNTKLVVGAGNNMNTTCLINTGDVDVDALTLSNWDGSTTTNKIHMHFDCSGIAGFDVGIPAATAAFEIRNTSGGGGFVHITAGGDVLFNDTTNSIYNDTSGGGFNFKSHGQLVLKKEASSAGDPLVWLNDTGQTTNKTIVLAQDGAEKGFVGLTGTSLSLGAGGSERVLIDSNGRVGINWGSGSIPQTLSVKGNMYMRQGDYITWNNGDCRIGGISGYHLQFSTYTGSSMTEKMRITSGGDILIPGTQATSSQTGKLDIYHTADGDINNPHIRLWGPTNQDARIEFGSETNAGEGGYISYNDGDEGLYIGSRMSVYSEVHLCTGMNDGNPHSNQRLTVNSVGRTGHYNTTHFDREAFTKGGTVHGGGAASGANNNNPGAFAFVNSTPVRGSNTRYSFWTQSGDAYPNSSNYIDFTIQNAYMYRVLIKGSHSSATAEMAMFVIYGLANSSGTLPPRIQEVQFNTPSFNGDHGGSGNTFGHNSGQFNCRVMGYGTSGGTRGSTGTYDTTLRIEYTGNNNQGLLAFIERWDTGT